MSAQGPEHRFEGELWRYEGEAAWIFVTLPPAISDDIQERAGEPRRGFGAVRVRVTLGATTWATSVVPDRERGAYLLPVKKAVRTEEGIVEGDRVALSLEVL